VAERPTASVFASTQAPAETETGVSVRLLSTDQVVFDERTVLKCRYSCPAWGRRWTCAPGTWGPDELIPLLQRYRHVLLLTGTDSPAVARSALRVERAAFAQGYAYALAVAVTLCSECSACTYPDGECRQKPDLRPESPMAGIDTLQTLARQGLSSEPGEAFVRAAYVFLE
jgi:predicted metal-binding protein